MEHDKSTEERIKQAAWKIFHQKGYAATRTRDIAEEAGINLALLNYYYRSKEKLFGIVMTESLQKLFAPIMGVLNDANTSLSHKIDCIVGSYTEMLLENPNLPVFVVGEIQANPAKLQQILGFKRSFLTGTVFFRQLSRQLKKAKIPYDPLHYIMNTIALAVFPFIGHPLLSRIGGLTDTSFLKLVEERKTLAPEWIKSMIKLDKEDCR